MCTLKMTLLLSKSLLLLDEWKIQLWRQ
jgi:hypothetical protein